MYISGRLIGLGSHQAQNNLYNRQGRNSSLKSLLLGVNSNNSYFQDSDDWDEAHKTPLAGLCSSFNDYLDSDWKIQFEEDANSEIQKIQFLYDNNLICVLPFQITEEDTGSISSDLILFNLNDTLGNDSNKNKMIINISAQNSIHYYSEEDWYHTIPSSQMETAYYDLRLRAEDEDDYPLNALISEVDKKYFPMEIKFSIAQSLDKNMIIFRIYSLEQRYEILTCNYFEKHYLKQYELILLKTQISNEDAFLWAEARCSEPQFDEHGYNTITRKNDISECSGFSLRNLTAIDWWNFNCTAQYQAGYQGQTYTYTFENVSVGGFHTFEELENEAFLENAPLLYNKKYEITTSNDQADISIKYPQFLTKEKMIKTQTSLQSNNENVTNVNIGEKCVKRTSTVFPFSINEDTLIAQRGFQGDFTTLSQEILKNYLVLSPTYMIPCGKAFMVDHGAQQLIAYHENDN